MIERQRRGLRDAREQRLGIFIAMQEERDSDNIVPVAAAFAQQPVGARQDVLILLPQGRQLRGHAREKHHRAPGQMPDEGLRGVMFRDFAGRPARRRRHGEQIDAHIRPG